MGNFNGAETMNLEAVFPRIAVYLCDFHREQP